MNYVISLKRTPERLETFLNNNQHMDFQIFDAVDGTDLEPIGQYNKYARANALSHIELWKKCAEGTEDFLICEDDAELHRDLQRALDGLKAAQHPYDFIAWGWNFDAELFAGILPDLSPVSMKFNPDHMAFNKRGYLNTPVDPVFMRLYHLFGSCCYSISPYGAQQFLAILDPIKPEIEIEIPRVYTRTISPPGMDCAMSAAFGKTLSMVCFPPMALTENDHKISTVHGKYDQA
jgi:GR25 family glycosyltransferase involved in LPS biosynthesis